jgi:hypothetical protein
MQDKGSPHSKWMSFGPGSPIAPTPLRPVRVLYRLIRASERIVHLSADKFTSPEVNSLRAAQVSIVSFSGIGFDKAGAPFRLPRSYWARRKGFHRKVTERPSWSSHAISCDASSQSHPVLLELPCALSSPLSILHSPLFKHGPHTAHAPPPNALPFRAATRHLIGRTVSLSATVPSPAFSSQRGATTHVVGLEVRRDLGLCAIAIGKELLLVVQQLFAGLGGVLCVLGCRLVSMSLLSKTR